MDFIKSFFKNKTIMFYVMLGMAVLSIVAAIIYAAVYSGDLNQYMSWLGFILMLLAAVAFVALSVFDLARWGAAAMAMLNFAALLVAALATYKYFVDTFAIAGGVGAALKDSAAIAFIIVAVLLVVCSIAANVAAWRYLKKKQEATAA